MRKYCQMTEEWKMILLKMYDDNAIRSTQRWILTDFLRRVHGENILTLHTTHHNRKEPMIPDRQV